MAVNSNMYKILIVDDAPENIHILIETLKDDYKLVTALNGEKAIALAGTDPIPDIILLDVMMPGINGYEVCETLKANERTREIPIIFVTALKDEADEAKGFDLGAVDFISKPFKPALVRARIRNHLELKHHRDNLEALVQQRTKELILTQDAIIISLSSLAETRDNETGGHIRRTQNYVKALGEHLKNHPRFNKFFNDRNIDLMVKSSPLHDIGKVGIPDNILHKPGRLTQEEFEVIKSHTIIGRDAILAAEVQFTGNSFLQIAREIAYTHHEHWDGTGYPQGLKGDHIPIPGRIMAMADVYDALSTRRIYKPPLTHEESVATMIEEKKNFDPDIFEAFLKLGDTFQQIAQKFADK